MNRDRLRAAALPAYRLAVLLTLLFIAWTLRNGVFVYNGYATPWGFSSEPGYLHRPAVRVTTE